MDVSSNFSKGFTDEDDDDDDFGRREGSLQKDFTGGVDGKNNSDQKLNTLRSKHSVTEQRRRSKINDRFQILRDLIPQSDQKRDKASFLLEVIEYIQFLQDKIQSYESAYPGCNQENAKLMPWVKVLFRSFWEKARKKTQGPLEGIHDCSQVIKNVSDSPGFVFTGGETIPAPQALLSNDLNPSEYEHTDPTLASRPSTVSIHLEPYCSGGVFPESHLDLRNTSVTQSHWMRSCSTVGADVQNNEQRIDDETASISSAYSQGLHNVLTHALQSSGVDLSQAIISVQIKLGKRSSIRNISNLKYVEDPNDTSGNLGFRESRVGSNCEELEQSHKRYKLERS